MSFNSFLRRASSSILPLSVRSSSGVFSSFRNVEKCHDQILSVSRFSTTTDDKIVKNLKSDCTAWKPNILHIPAEFPFEFEENTEHLIEERKKYLFRRKYQDEIIEVAADGFNEVDHEPCITMTAHVVQPTLSLQFEMTAYRDQIDIYGCKVSDRSGIGHLNIFQNFIEIRGINSSMIDLVCNCYGITTPSNDMVDQIESDCNAQRSFKVPDGFPFSVEREANGPLELQRMFEDEKIIVCIYPDDVDYKASSGEAFKMTLEIYDGDVWVYGNISVFPHHADPIRIRDMTIRHSLNRHQEDFQKFWELRGINPKTTNFIIDFLEKIDNQQDCRSIGKNWLDPHLGYNSYKSFGDFLMWKSICNIYGEGQPTNV